MFNFDDLRNAERIVNATTGFDRWDAEMDFEAASEHVDPICWCCPKREKTCSEDCCMWLNIGAFSPKSERCSFIPEFADFYFA